MAFKKFQPRSKGCKVDVSMEEFKKWLKKFDDDRDGRINMEELREAIRATGGWFSQAKAGRILKSVDTNSDGFIDEDEISKLVVFAEKQFGLRIVA
ncbi:hypothetical protein C2S52_000805 [Perilla frutescens var. hirtella]|nr:hypothetical protein C2S51_007635 [Perilla frutescens var. frutescens]KAH6800341.1 hypothetical protein C2S52_000805 [Perilla frutescens var. hirtella]